MKTFMKYLLFLAVIAVTGCSASPDAEHFSRNEPTTDRLAPTNSLTPALEDSWDEHGIQRMIQALNDSTVLQEEAMELGHLLIALETYYPWETAQNAADRPHAKGGKEDPLGKLLAATTLKYYSTNTYQGLLDIFRDRPLLKELLDYFTQESILSETERMALTQAIEAGDSPAIAAQIEMLYDHFIQHFIRFYHLDGIWQSGTEQTFPADYDDGDMKMLTEADSPIRKAVIRLITTLIQKYYDIEEAADSSEKMPETSQDAPELEPSEAAPKQTEEQTKMETDLPVGAYIAKNVEHKAADTGELIVTYELQLTIEKQFPSQYRLKALRLIDQNDREDILNFPSLDIDLAFDPEMKKPSFVVKIDGKDNKGNPLLLYFEGTLHLNKDKIRIEGKFTITKEDHTILSQSGWTAELGADNADKKKVEEKPSEPATSEQAAPEPATSDKTEIDSEMELPAGTHIAKNAEHKAANGKPLFTYELQFRITKQSDNGILKYFINFLKLIDQKTEQSVMTFSSDTDPVPLEFDPKTGHFSFSLKVNTEDGGILLLIFEGTLHETVIEGTFTVKKEDGILLSQSSWTAKLMEAKTDTPENKEKPVELELY